MSVISMQGGDGDGSYAQNSGPQNNGFHAYGKTYLAKAIRIYKKLNDLCISHNDKKNQDESSPRITRIADYGCCYGRNTLDCAQFIVSKLLELDHPQENHVKEETSLLQPELIHEFQYFFVDLPSNDFNSLFYMLHSPEFAAGFQGLKFFPNGVPGSFYDCVIPKGTVDFAITTYSLHWISQAPAVLLDRNGPIWNGGYVWIPTDDSGAVSEAYAKQFQEDARRFLRSRSEEMRSNGVMFILSTCRSQETTVECASYQYLWNGYFEQTWKELIEDGIIEASERDGFNVPHYDFSEAEFKEALQSVAELELLELHVLENCDYFPSQQMKGLYSDPDSFGKFICSFIQSLIQPMLDAYIGKTRASQFFDRLQVVATKNAHLTENLLYDILIAIIRKK